jgi:hypothetical protein
VEDVWEDDDDEASSADAYRGEISHDMHQSKPSIADFKSNILIQDKKDSFAFDNSADDIEEGVK